MVNYENLLSEQSREKIRTTRVEVARLYALPNRWLAAEILRLARAAQKDLRAEGFSPGDCVYDAAFAWNVLPELAKRLGATQFNQDERLDRSICGLSDSAFRFHAGYFIFNSSTNAIRNSILSREVANGNPVVFALDRVAVPEQGDPIAVRLREIAHVRSVPFAGTWSPEFMGGNQQYREPEDLQNFPKGYSHHE